MVISYDFWQRHFAGAADVVGRTVSTTTGAFEVLGVMPRGFAFIVVLFLVGLWAAVIPARRASRADPILALRAPE